MCEKVTCSHLTRFLLDSSPPKCDHACMLCQCGPGTSSSDGLAVLTSAGQNLRRLSYRPSNLVLRRRRS